MTRVVRERFSRDGIGQRRRKECCDKVAVSNVIIISCGWSGRVIRAREKTRLQEDMDFNRILFGVRGNCKGSNTKTSPSTLRLI
jgi:hypothetical protein